MYKVTITSTGVVHEFDDRQKAKMFAKAQRKLGNYCFLQYPK